MLFSIQNWNLAPLDSNTLLDDFYFKLNGCADRHAPVRKLNAKEVKFKTEPWINPDLAKMIRIKNNLFARKKRQPLNDNIKMLYNKFKIEIIENSRNLKNLITLSFY